MSRSAEAIANSREARSRRHFKTASGFRGTERKNHKKSEEATSEKPLSVLGRRETRFEEQDRAQLARAGPVSPAVAAGNFERYFPTADMSAKILISSAEYSALKAAGPASAEQQQSQQQQQCSGLQKEEENDEGSTTEKKIAAITKETVVREENAERRRDLGLPSPSPPSLVGGEELPAASDSGQEGEEDGDGGVVGCRNALNFLPRKKATIAEKLISGLLAHPEVDVKNGLLIVKGRKLGHLIQALHVLFVDSKKARADKKFLKKFLRQSGLNGERRFRRSKSLGQAKKKNKKKKEKEEKKNEKKEKNAKKRGKEAKQSSVEEVELKDIRAFLK